MRTLRLSLAGTVILALLGGLGGAVVAQDEEADTGHRDPDGRAVIRRHVRRRRDADEHRRTVSGVADFVTSGTERRRRRVSGDGTPHVDCDTRDGTAASCGARTTRWAGGRMGRHVSRNGRIIGPTASGRHVSSARARPTRADLHRILQCHVTTGDGIRRLISRASCPRCDPPPLPSSPIAPPRLPAALDRLLLAAERRCTIADSGRRRGTARVRWPPGPRRATRYSPPNIELIYDQLLLAVRSVERVARWAESCDGASRSATPRRQACHRSATLSANCSAILTAPPVRP